MGISANIKVYDKDLSKVEAICDEAGCISCSSEIDAVNGSSCFIAVKPDMVRKL